MNTTVAVQDRQDQRGERVKIADVARRARVSTATVSLVLNCSPHVSERTKAKVEQAIKELGYVPDYHARQLRLSHQQRERVANASRERAIEDLSYSIFAGVHNFRLALEGLSRIGREVGIDPQILELMAMLEREVGKVWDELRSRVKERR